MIKGKTGALLTALSVLIGIGIIAGRSSHSATADTAPAPKPALSVTVIQPAMRDIPMTLTANGSIAAWQEAIIGAEISDLRLIEVNVQVGETVKKGQLLAVFSDESVLADVAQSRAALAEAEANLADARVNAERAGQISASGALSSQQVNQYLTGEKTAKAKVQSAKAQLDSQLLRLKYTKVLAGDEGVISSRSATLGAVAAKGQELFRMIRQNRLEWRGEVTASEMAQLKPGIAVSVEVPNVGSIKGKIRALAPTLDVQSRNGLVYVDLPEAARMACARECSAGANSKSVSTPVSSSPRLHSLCGKASAMSSNWASKAVRWPKSLRSKCNWAEEPVTAWKYFRDSIRGIVWSPPAPHS